jgi:DNA-binding transcriptional ArsR family regulator
MTRFKELDPILHSQLRLAVISLLVSTQMAEFTYIQEQTRATAGNLSVQITRLKEAGYIEVSKKFRNNYPQTLCSITQLGRQKFSEYVKALKDYLNPER